MPTRVCFALRCADMPTAARHLRQTSRRYDIPRQHTRYHCRAPLFDIVLPDAAPWRTRVCGVVVAFCCPRAQSSRYRVARRNAARRLYCRQRFKSLQSRRGVIFSSEERRATARQACSEHVYGARQAARRKRPFSPAATLFHGYREYYASRVSPARPHEPVARW